jgi:hypothetical protein
MFSFIVLNGDGEVYVCRYRCMDYLTIFQKGPQYTGIKVYNNLPDNIKQLSSNKSQSKKALLQFLYLHSFYSIKEFFKYKDK